MRYAEIHPQDLVTLVREGDEGALFYLNSLPTHQMRAKLRAGAKPWRPILIKAQVLKDWEDEERGPDGRWGSGGGGAPIRGVGGGGSGTAITHIEEGMPREPHPGEGSPIAHYPTGTGAAPRPGMGDTAIGAKELDTMKESPVTGPYIRPDGTFTPERQALHDSIVEKAVSGHASQDDPKMVMVAGGSASGKSSSLEQGLIDTPKDAVRVDSDEMAKQLPEAKEMIAAGDKNWGAQTHEEGAYLAGRVQAAATEKQANIVLDGGRASRMSDKIDAAHAAGYQVEGHIIARDPAAAAQEVAQRGAGESKAPPEVMAQRYSDLSKTVPELAPKFDNLTIHENTGTDAQPELHPVAEVHNGILTVSDNAGYNRFLGYGTGKKRKGKKRALKYSEDQPRVPAGEPGGGEFGSGGGGGARSAADADHDAVGHAKETGEPHPQTEQARSATGAAALQPGPPATSAEVARSLVSEAGQARPEATAALREAAEKTPGASLLGDNPPAKDGYPEHSLKTQDSTDRKITEKQNDMEAKTGVRPTPDEVGAQLNDILRYTGSGSKEDYASMVKGLAQGLVDKGYTFAKVKNTWGDPPKDTSAFDVKAYRGLNTVVKDSNGRTFELQFHTPESFKTKEEDQHPLYEEWRLSSTSQDRKDELHDQMMGMAVGLGSSPPGVSELTPDYFAGLKPR